MGPLSTSYASSAYYWVRETEKKWEKKKVSMLCKQYLATAKTLLCYHHWFCYKIQSTVPRKLL